jgi:hypothetical protein
MIKIAFDMNVNYLSSVELSIGIKVIYGGSAAGVRVEAELLIA